MCDRYVGLLLDGDRVVAVKPGPGTRPTTPGSSADGGGHLNYVADKTQLDGRLVEPDNTLPALQPLRDGKFHLQT